MNLKLSFHPEFCQDTLCHSDTAMRCGLDNRCPAELLDNLCRLSNLLGDIQNRLGLGAGQLKINSGFRAPALNEQVGGVPHSQHCLGLAADVVCPCRGGAYELACAIEASGCEFDQLIVEFGRWVHVSCAPAGAVPRRECLSIFSKDEGYLEGIVKR